MSYPTTERHKILENAVAEQSYQIDRGLFSEDKVFHGVIDGIEKDSEFTYCWLKVVPVPPNDPAQAGDLKFLNLGQDADDDIPDGARYVKVYVLNLPLPAVQAYFQVGQIVTFWALLRADDTDRDYPWKLRDALVRPRPAYRQAHKHDYGLGGLQRQANDLGGNGRATGKSE